MNLYSFLPNEINNKLKDINVNFKILKKRKTKLGDCKYIKKENQFYISINEKLNKNQFLLTLIHEIAHVISIKKYGLKIKPHGKEWKLEYGKLIKIGIKKKIFSRKIEPVLNNSLQNIKSSHIYNYDLLEKLTKNKKIKKTLKDIKDGEKFEFNGEKFIKIKKLTKRYLCQKIKNNKKYYIHPFIEIK